jgi:2,4-dienoyl-CoA reductase-like NADH-dependent reductase (Old Yellow Enzyme family)
VQLAHAGRKASTYAPWVRSGKYTAEEDEGGWPNKVYGPSAIPFSDKFPMPREMTEEEFKRVEDAFIAATERCKVAGFDFIEIHGAHGYLIHEVLSPLSNVRTDSYGGSLENRMRYPLRICEVVRKAWGDRPLLLRISATDFAEGPEKNEKGEWVQWGIEQSKVFCAEAAKLGIDFFDVSAGMNWYKQKFEIKPGAFVCLPETLF